jgi:hypothetical protein
MRSRQYTVNLKRVKRLHAYNVYADRTVEIGFIEQGEFIPYESVRQSRQRVAELILLSRDLGYPVEKRYL